MHINLTMLSLFSKKAADQMRRYTGPPDVRVPKLKWVMGHTDLGRFCRKILCNVNCPRAL